MPTRRSPSRFAADWLIGAPAAPAGPVGGVDSTVSVVHGASGRGDIDLYVIHWNAPEWCLATVRSMQRARDVRPRISVIDNGGMTEEVASQLGEVTVIRTGSNLGFTGAANLALGMWRDEHPSADTKVVIACHDVELHPDALSVMLRAADLPAVGIVGVRIGGSAPATAPPSDSLEPIVVTGETWVTGACMVLRRDCIDVVGRFDERLGSYGEDADYCWRAIAAGWRVVSVPGIRVRWQGQASPEAARLTPINSVLLVRYRRGRFAFGLRWIAEWYLTARNAALWVATSRRATMAQRLKINALVLRQLPLLWRRVANDSLRWTD